MAIIDCSFNERVGCSALNAAVGSTVKSSNGLLFSALVHLIKSTRKIGVIISRANTGLRNFITSPGCRVQVQDPCVVTLC